MPTQPPKPYKYPIPEGMIDITTDLMYDIDAGRIHIAKRPLQLRQDQQDQTPCDGVKDPK